VRAPILLLTLLLPPSLLAQDLFMARSKLSFPEAMAVLQESIGEQGYRVSRVQRVDIGLTASGYQTDKYRVVFFGNRDEVAAISKQHPGLVPFIPLKIAIFAEGEETILVASSFLHLRPFYADPELQQRFDHWEADLNEILERVRAAQ
jgi:uncharacterized protein (DUF302 family)